MTRPVPTTLNACVVAATQDASRILAEAREALKAATWVALNQEQVECVRAAFAELSEDAYRFERE